MRISPANGLLVALLIAVGVVAWMLQLSARLEVDPSALARLPSQIGGWTARDLPLEEVVEEMLGADFNLQRAYQHSFGDTVWAYVGYYGTRRGGRPEHTPWACYEAHGWEIVESRVLEIDSARDLRANQIVVEQRGERRLVLFWFRSRERTGIVGSLGLTLEQARSRITAGRADAALIRVSTPLHPGEDTAARSRLTSFAAAFDLLVGAHWPAERSSGS
jgi:EpsI family protein